jgi:biotin carboxyl carrier protein
MIIPLLAVLLLIMSLSAAAEERSEAVYGKGMIAAPEKITLLAPMGGQVKDFSWKTGDTAETGMAALEVIPSQICAADSGVVRGLHALIGDQAGAVIAQYGALCYVERQGIWHVHASTASAYNKPKNRDIRIGDVLRVREGSGDDEKTGEGTVIFVDGKNFVLEMEHGDFELEDDVSLYLGTGSSFKGSDLAGKGKVLRPQALRVTGDGIVASVLVKEGDTVERGQPLFLMDSPAARYKTQAGSPQALFPQSSLIESILVSPGQTVMQGQALMTLIPENVLEAALEIDELDIAKVRVGQYVNLVIDAYPNEEREGVIREISPLGNTLLDTTKYSVYVSIDNTEGLLLGMHVTGYVKQ